MGAPDQQEQQDGAGAERRKIGRDFEEWRWHVDNRLDLQDKALAKILLKLDPIATNFEASKVGAIWIRWLATVGAAVLTIWVSLHFGGPK